MTRGYKHTLRVRDEVMAELETACDVFSDMHSSHEGYAIIKEEMDELWDEVKSKSDPQWHNDRMRREAMHVAAMAIRFILNVCEEE